MEYRRFDYLDADSKDLKKLSFDLVGVYFDLKVYLNLHPEMICDSSVTEFIDILNEYSDFFNRNLSEYLSNNGKFEVDRVRRN